MHILKLSPARVRDTSGSVPPGQRGRTSPLGLQRLQLPRVTEHGSCTFLFDLPLPGISSRPTNQGPDSVPRGDLGARRRSDSVRVWSWSAPPSRGCVPFPSGLLAPKAGFPAPGLRRPSDQPGGRPGPVTCGRTVFPHRAKLAFGEQGLPEHAGGLGGALFAAGRQGGAGLRAAGAQARLVRPLHAAGLRALGERLGQEAPGAGLQVEHGGPGLRVRVAAAACTEGKHSVGRLQAEEPRAWAQLAGPELPRLGPRVGVCFTS